jgi:hypothetical protein
MKIIKTQPTESEWRSSTTPRSWQAERPMSTVADVRARVEEGRNFVHCYCGRWAPDPPSTPCGCAQSRAIAEAERRALAALKPKGQKCPMGCGVFTEAGVQHDCRPPAPTSGPASLDEMSRRTRLAGLKADLEQLGLDVAP